MHLDKTGLALCVAALLLAGCKQPAAASEDAANATATVADAAAAVDAAATEDADAPEDAAPGGYKISERDGITMAVAMTAGVELCGLSKPAESQAALARIAAEAKDISAAEINAIYASAKLQGKAAAAKDPAKFESDCAGLRKMGDPAEIKKMEAAAKELEAWAKKMESAAQ